MVRLRKLVSALGAIFGGNMVEAEEKWLKREIKEKYRVFPQYVIVPCISYYFYEVPVYSSLRKSPKYLENMQSENRI